MYLCAIEKSEKQSALIHVDSFLFFFFNEMFLCSDLLVLRLSGTSQANRVLCPTKANNHRCVSRFIFVFIESARLAEKKQRHFNLHLVFKKCVNNTTKCLCVTEF